MATPRTVADVDAELMVTHEKFLRADRRGDVADATELWLHLEELFELRARIPLQRDPHD